MGGYNQSYEEIAVKRRKLNSGQSEEIFFNDENSQQTLTKRFASFLSKTVTPIRSLWRFMRSSSANVNSVSLSNEMASQRFGSEVTSEQRMNNIDRTIIDYPASSTHGTKIDDPAEGMKNKVENEVTSLSGQSNGKLFRKEHHRQRSIFSTRSRFAVDNKQPLRSSDYFEDEEIRILEAKIAEEDADDKDVHVIFDSKTRVPALPNDEDDVQIVSVIEHFTEEDSKDFSSGNDDILSFKRSLFFPVKVSLDFLSMGFPFAPSLIGRKGGLKLSQQVQLAVQVIEQRESYGLGTSDLTTGGSHLSSSQQLGHTYDDQLDDASTISGSVSLMSGTDILSVPSSKPNVSEVSSSHTGNDSRPSSVSPWNGTSRTGSPLLAHSSSRTTLHRIGRWKLDESSRFTRVRPQGFWRHAGKKQLQNDKIFSKLKKVYSTVPVSEAKSENVINIDAKERYRCFLKNLSLDSNILEPLTPVSQRPTMFKNVDTSPTKILMRGKSVLDQLVFGSVTPSSTPPSLHNGSLSCDSRVKESKPENLEKSLNIKDSSDDATSNGKGLQLKNKTLHLCSRRSVSVENDAFEARLETEKSNSVLTQDRLLRHMQEAGLRQKRAEALTLEKRLREIARRDEEISLEEEIRKKLTVSGYIFRERKPKVEKIEFPELDEKALMVIERVWYGDKSLDEKFGERITRKDLLTLRGLDWLNDEVIDTYLGLICERSKQDPNLPKIYAFTTFFYTNLVQYGYGKVKRWTRKVDIFSYDMLFVPVHLGAHWCLAVIDFQKSCIEYYDSMGGTNERCLNALRLYLNEESMDKRKKPFETAKWKCYSREDIPQQMNGSDCGMFACKFAEFASRRAQIVFSQENMPYYRQRMVYEIYRKALM